jgi:Tol biopolymer transport system component/DNA-binding winged helix-turn-helix (wHTH) protein
MAETEPQVRLLRFGSFEVDLRSGELRKGGAKQRFGGQPFQVLSVLLERPGEVVTREELQKRLWPDTFVDVDHNLNTAINKIREVLGDSAESPRYVETLPRRGYRFIGELERPVEPVVHAVPVEADRGSRSRRVSLEIAAGVLVISVVALAAGVAYRWFRPQRPQEQAALTAIPFTALPGQATSPVFSPDGSRIAFAWNGDPTPGAKGFDLYVKALGSETLLRLTHHPSETISAAWSPDGTQIAFHRLAGTDTGIYAVPALGGPERKLRSTRLPWRPFSLISPLSIISWSPDGKWIAFADKLPEEEVIGMYLLSTETLETRQIPISPKCDWQGVPAFSHNGGYLAYWCFRNVGDEAGLYSSSLPDGKPQLIASFREYPDGLTWSADDESLIYSLSNWDTNKLGQVSVTNGSVKTLAIPVSAARPTVSAKGDKLAFSTAYSHSKNWRRDLLHPESPATELIPSSRGQYFAQYSPDGRHIAFQSERSGVPGVWISNEDGSNVVQISNPIYVSGSPQWSPDGNRIAFDSLQQDHWEIYVADVAERKPRKLVTNISDVNRPHWSRDGKWIYFRSDEPGRKGIYRCSASGGDAIALAKDIEGRDPQESFDGKTIYFASHAEKSMLKKVALVIAQTGTESEVDGFPRLNHFDLWSLTPGGIYFVPAEAPRSVSYFDFATRHVHPIFEIDKDFGFGLSVSPDGRWLLYSQVGDVNSDIMLVEHFH